ncbi:DNA gyrase [Ewingella americana]
MTNPPEMGTHEINTNPITADYDLFTIIPMKNQGDNIRPLSIPPRLLRGKFNLDFLTPRSPCGGTENVNKGNIHFFGEVIVNTLNVEIKRLGYTGGKLIWHNDETGNPFSPGFDEKDKPIFFLPTGEVFLATSKHQLITFYHMLKSKGYAPEYSPRFGF